MMARDEHYEVDLELIGYLYGTNAVIKGIARGTFYSNGDGTDIVVKNNIDNLAWGDLIEADAIGREVTA